MLSIRSSSARSHRRRSVAMSPAAALLLFRGVSGTTNADNNYRLLSNMPKVKFIKWNPSVLLNECEGDCDGDHQCADGLVCYQREAGNEEVPGLLVDQVTAKTQTIAFDQLQTLQQIQPHQQVRHRCQRLLSQRLSCKPVLI